ncbi:hypothetical protein SD960_08080 [Flavobacterium sp. MMLR14_040]|uniref:hypothetical protein n=1 Tax=Flavobacterium sp. MMLR14_040 TaxID=3093843 RepID=UPI00298FBDF1|nr:hypothetical protein [Flavobacterium sp. MMLR14_040]MDW8850045.1 hypothetical protein [Flavobacterium sp. MMLR14_040]
MKRLITAFFQIKKQLEGYCYFKITASPNANSDNMLDWTTKFSGLIITGYVKLTLKQDSKNKAPKAFNPFTLIPSYTGTPISMKFGEGKENNF